jgi:hypothetical protein
MRMEHRKCIAYIRRLLFLIKGEFATSTRILQGIEAEAGDSFALKWVARDLQFQDIISQRLQHLVEGFEKVEDHFVDAGFEVSFLALQAFQLMAIGHDLEKIVLNIRRITARVTTPTFNGPADAYSRLFPKFDYIKHLFDVSERIPGAGPLTLGTSLLSANQAKACMSVYTMQSERIVLDCFLRNMLSGDRSELLRCYDRELNKIRDESVELF